ncbi:MAG: hypothetical protein ACI89X_002157 [Planctomycetota bacterium]|jgi:hypothetical protein
MRACLLFALLCAAALLTNDLTASVHLGPPTKTTNAPHGYV